ncbi:MAG TPA: hypothetical protein VEO53_14775, partial [Candidatus Binatia bacterium]|nr:hypothetical protein [Candidatus Binatia bacterium]
MRRKARPFCPRLNAQLESGKVARTWNGPRGSAPYTLTSLASDPAQPLVAAAFGDLSVRIWNTDTGQLVHVLTGLDDQAYKMSFSRDGRTLVTIGGARSTVATLWDAVKGQRKDQIHGVVPADGVGVYGLAVSPSGDRVAVGGNKGGVRVFSAANGQNISTIPTVGAAATSV